LTVYVHVCTLLTGGSQLPMKNERLVVQVEPSLKKALMAYSKESGVPISEFIRRVLVEALKKVGR
jgi:predicted HicB family RNase H-like nuclease